MQEYCMNCMLPMAQDGVCPHCGYSQSSDSAVHVLRPGTVLNERYLIGNVIGQGGFGITYIGRDLKLNMRIAMKEYYPNGCANRNVEASDSITITDKKQQDFIEDGKSKFLREARVLAQFHGDSGVVDIRDFFEANNTAYIVMEYLEGKDLRKCLKERAFSADEIFSLMEPIFETLEKIHEKGIIHRDISPDNIMMLDNKTLKLMDFGAARFANYSDQRSVSVVLKSGYAPEEQYRPRGVQGPWTDIYALCATIYKCITTITLEDALERSFEDKTKWPSELGIPISVQQEAVLKKGLSIRQNDRFQNLGQLREALKGDGKQDDIDSITVVDISARSKTDVHVTGDAVCPDVKDEKTIYDPRGRADAGRAIKKDEAEIMLFPQEKTYKSRENSVNIQDKTKKSKRGTYKQKKTIGIVIGIVLLIVIVLCAVWSVGGISQEKDEVEEEIVVFSSMFWGDYVDQSISYNSDSNTYDTDDFIKKMAYQMVSLDGVDYEMSVLPATVKVDPSEGEDTIQMTFLDRFGEAYDFVGTFELTENGRLQVTWNDSETVVSPAEVEYEVEMYCGRVRIFADEKSVTLVNVDELENNRVVLCGTLPEGETGFEDVQGMNLTYTSDDLGYCDVMFTDGGTTMDGYVNNYWASIQSIYVAWTQAERPYNGRTEVFTEKGSLSFNFVNTYPYGFILIEDGKCYIYQNPAEN